MSDLHQRLLDYMETLAGERPDLRPAEGMGLPLFLRHRYGTYAARIFGRSVVLAIETHKQVGCTPAEYGKHAGILQSKLGVPVVLVIPALLSYARNRMVQMKIPFIVPGSQTFIPDGLIDLRERFPMAREAPRETLSPAAQCTVLYHLLRGSLAHLPLKDVAKKVQYSPMMLTKVKDELVSAGICKCIRSGRSVAMEFPASGSALWTQVKPHMASPVKRTRWIKWEAPDGGALLAAMSALSHQTMIADDRLPTYATSRENLAEKLGGNHWIVCEDAEMASARVEVWAYDPKLLGGEQTVDPLSLYLSLQTSPDERVQIQLAQLIRDVTW